jgi:putative oxidoreductase
MNRNNVATIPSSSVGPFIAAVVQALERVPMAIPQLLFRLAPAVVFWRSGQAKLASWDTTILLFANEYNVPLLPPELAAYLATAVELAAPMALILGLGTRLAAAAMLGMTLVIQVFVYPASYSDHLLWAGPLLFLLLRGAGSWSLDRLVRRRFMAA